MKNRLADMRRQLVGAKHDKPDGKEKQAAAFAVLLYGKINQKKINWQPYPHLGDGNHYGVEPIGMKPVEKQKKLGINVGEEIHFYSSTSSMPLFNIFQIRSFSSTMP